MTAANPDFNKSKDGSVDREMASNPEMTRKAWNKRLTYMGDQKAMELWARDGFVSSGGSSHDISEGDHRQGTYS